MTVFVDASAIVAILAQEDGFEELATALDGFEQRLTSPVACWEAATALVRSYRYAPVDAQQEVTLFLQSLTIEIVPVAEPEWNLAFEAYAEYGKGVSPARLNMGDCFAYACARANNARLLYKGDDFAQTDLA